MLVLSNLLPGLRDLRVPLVVGYAWLLLGAIVYTAKPELFPRQLMSAVPEVTSNQALIPGLAVGLVLSVGAYVLGILSVAFITPVARIGLGLVGVVIATPLLLLSLIFEKKWVWAREKIRRAGRTLLLPLIHQRSDDAFEMRSLAERLISERFVTDRAVREEFFSRLDYRAIDRYLIELERANVTFMFNRGEDTYSPSRLKEVLTTEPGDPTNLRQSVVHAARYDTVRRARERGALINALVDLDEHANELSHEASMAPARLIIANPAAFDRWDRLESEFSFRSGIAAPVASVAAISPILGLHWPFSVAAILMALALMIDSVRKAMDADQQMSLYLETRAVLPANLGTAGAVQFYWRDWDPKVGEVQASAGN